MPDTPLSAGEYQGTKYIMLQLLRSLCKVPKMGDMIHNKHIFTMSGGQNAMKKTKSD